MLMPGANILNCGFSLGLQYPMIYGKIADQWVIWDRHTGIVAHVETESNTAIAQTVCAKKCEELNNVPPMDDATRHAIDDTP